MNDQSIRRLAPDRAAIERHLDLLFGYLEGFAPVRLFGELGTPEKGRSRRSCRLDRGWPSASNASPSTQRPPSTVSTSYQVPWRRVARLVLTMLSHRAHFSSTLTRGCCRQAPLPRASPGSGKSRRRLRRRHRRGSRSPSSLLEACRGSEQERIPKAHPSQECRRRARRRRPLFQERPPADPHRRVNPWQERRSALVRIVEDFAIEYELADLIERVDALPLEPAFAPLSSVTKRPLSTTDIDGLMTSQTRPVALMARPGSPRLVG